MTIDSQARAPQGAHAVRPARGGASGGGGRGGGARSLDDSWALLGDALFTYCLSVLCDEEEAVAAIREVRQLSVRNRRRLRHPEETRAWLYALARYTCLLRMEAAPVRSDRRAMTGRHASYHSRLAKLAWPEAAGLPALLREVLELAGRHGLESAELAAVLDLRAEEAGVLTAQAVCELERTAVVLAVLTAEDCPELARLAERRGAVLGLALRGELVRHVDACPTCRGTAERAAAAGPWPGTLRAPAVLELVTAPAATWREPGGEGLFAALSGTRAGRGARRAGRGGDAEVGPATGAEPGPTAEAGPEPRSGAGPTSAGGAEPAPAGRAEAVSGTRTEPTSGAGPTCRSRPVSGARGGESPVYSAAQEIRFDRRGFPLHRTARSERAALLRQRAMASSVIALVVAAPVVALWAAHHGQGTAQATEESPVSSVRVDTSPQSAPPPPAFLPPRAPAGGHRGSSATTTGDAPALVALGASAPAPAAAAAAPGRLAVTAGELGGRTVVTLANAGGTAVVWQATSTAPWLRLSRDSGTLQPGAQFTLLVTVDAAAEPDGPWTAQLAISPSSSVVILRGPGTGGRRGLPPPVTSPGSPSPAPTGTPPVPTGPSTGPSAGPPTTPPPTPTPRPTGPSPSGPPSGSASPSPSASASLAAAVRRGR